jgi:hypothetical protein
MPIRRLLLSAGTAGLLTPVLAAGLLLLGHGFGFDLWPSVGSAGDRASLELPAPPSPREHPRTGSPASLLPGLTTGAAIPLSAPLVLQVGKSGATRPARSPSRPNGSRTGGSGKSRRIAPAASRPITVLPAAAPAASAPAPQTAASQPAPASPPSASTATTPSEQPATRRPTDAFARTGGDSGRRSERQDEGQQGDGNRGNRGRRNGGDGQENGGRGQDDSGRGQHGGGRGQDGGRMTASSIQPQDFAAGRGRRAQAERAERARRDPRQNRPSAPPAPPAPAQPAPAPPAPAPPQRRGHGASEREKSQHRWDEQAQDGRAGRDGRGEHGSRHDDRQGGQHED